MKIRNGFVSNSSSSSFLILSKEKIENYKQLLEIFKINIESPLYEMNKNLVQTIYNITEEQDIDYIIENYCSYDESANDKYPTKEEFRNNMKLVYNDYNYFSTEGTGVLARVANSHLWGFLLMIVGLMGAILFWFDVRAYGQTMEEANEENN